MKLPNSTNAFVPHAKLTDYLLSKTHIVGKLKARFFRSLGFNENNIEKLEEIFLHIASTQDIKTTISSPHGTKYIIDGSVQSPNGKTIHLRTVWIIEVNNDRPRFVTAYPV